MKNKKLVFLSIIMVCKISVGGEKSLKFNDLEKENNENPAKLIDVLLRPFGQISDFKIFDESFFSEECIDKTVIRGRVICNKKIKVKTQLHFAEGKELLCKINENYSNIKCVSNASSKKQED